MLFQKFKIIVSFSKGTSLTCKVGPRLKADVVKRKIFVVILSNYPDNSQWNCDANVSL